MMYLYTIYNLLWYRTVSGSSNVFSTQAGTAFFSYSPKASVSTTSSQVALGSLVSA